MLPELLVAAAVRLAGLVTLTSIALHLSVARCPALVLVGGGCASDLQLRAELPDRRGYKHETIMSCLVVLACAVSGSSVAVQDDPCLSLAARSCLSQAAQLEATGVRGGG